MAWEVFTRDGVVRNTGPAASITSMGRIALNKSASSILRKNGVENVFLLWDKDGRKCGIQATRNQKDSRAYHIIYGQKDNGSGFSCVTFLNFLHYDWSKTRAFPMEWNEQELMFVFTIPQEHLTGKPEQQQAVLGEVRRKDRIIPKHEKEGAKTLTQ